MNNDLTPEQMKELHQKLLDLRSRLDTILSSNDTVKPVALDEPIGRISRMDAIQVQRIAQANRKNLILQSKQVDASLADVKNNCYGFCRLCKKAIGYQRLCARVESPFCIKCQESIEKKRFK